MGFNNNNNNNKNEVFQVIPLLQYQVFVVAVLGCSILGCFKNSRKKGTLYGVLFYGQMRRDDGAGEGYEVEVGRDDMLVVYKRPWFLSALHLFL